MMNDNYQVYFLQKWYQPILNGEKTLTLRYPVGRWEVKEDDMVTANFKGQEEKILLEIISTGYKQFGSLTDTDAKLAGYNNIGEVKKVLEEIYGIPVENYNRIYYYRYVVAGTIEKVKSL